MNYIFMYSVHAQPRSRWEPLQTSPQYVSQQRRVSIQRLNIRDADETHLLPFFPLCWSTHQTTFFNYVIGIFILIVLSGLVNLHGLMRGMFPLQVISYLRGGGVAERLSREEDAWRCGCRKTKPQRNAAVWWHVFFFLHCAVWKITTPPKKNKSASNGNVSTEYTRCKRVSLFFRKNNQEKLAPLLIQIHLDHI